MYTCIYISIYIYMYIYIYSPVYYYCATHYVITCLTTMLDTMPSQEIVPSFGDNPIAIVSPDAGGVARAKMFMEAMTSMKVRLLFIFSRFVSALFPRAILHADGGHDYYPRVFTFSTLPSQESS